MPNVMVAQPNIGGTLCESSVIPCLVPCRKVWLTPVAGVPCSNAANIGEGKTWMQSEFSTCRIPLRATAPSNVCSVPAQETAKHHAKFGWPPVSNVTAVMKPSSEIR